MSLATGDNPTTATATANTVAAALASHACQSAVVQNDPASTVNLLVGDSSNQYIALQAGLSISMPVSNTNLIYVKTGSGTATVNYLWVI